MKRFFSVLIVVVALTAFLPRGSVFAAYNMQTAFPPADPNTSNNEYLTNMVHVDPVPTSNDTSTVVRISFTVDTAALDDETDPVDSNPYNSDHTIKDNIKGSFDKSDMNMTGGGWRSILDDDLEVTTQNGAFLVIGTAATANGTLVKDITASSTFYPTITESVGGNLFPNPVKQLSNLSLLNYNYKATNIGYYIWRKNPAAFFGNKNITVNIPVSGLTPNTTYYVGVILSEDFSYDKAYSNMVSFTTPATGVGNQVDITQTTTTGGDVDLEQVFESHLSCNITSLTGWTGCIAGMLYYIFYVPSLIFLRMTGWLFDVFLGLSLSSAIYNNPFISNGWGFVRDLTNIGFIIALIYIAISTIVGSGSSWKKALPNIIIMALLINFSLFMTRVVIDGGNILSSVFYNQINISNQQSSLISNAPGYVQERSISKGLIAGMGIQNMLSPEFFENVSKNVKSVQVVIALISLLGIAMNIALIWTFFMVAWTFLGRIVELWIAMIFSPLAFLSRAIPEIKGKLESYSWDKWLSNLVSVAFMPAIFLFFVILIIKFASDPINGGTLGTGTATDWTAMIVAILLKFMIIFILLSKARNLAISMSGEAGKMIVGVGKMIGGAAIGLAGGAAIGVAGAGLRAGASAIGERVKASSTFKKIQGAKDNQGITGWAARKSLKGFEGFEKSSFDLRQSKTMGAIGGALTSKIPGLEDLKGVNFNRDALSKVPLIDLSTKAGEGGYTGAQKRAEDKAVAEAHETLLKGEEAKAQDKRAAQYKKDMEEMRTKYEAMYGKGNFNAAIEEQFRKQYAAGNAEINLAGIKVTGSGSYGDTRSTFEVNKEKLEKQAELMRAGGSGILAAASQSLGGVLKVKASEVQTASGATMGAGATATAAVVAGAAGAGATLLGGVGIAGQQYTEQKGRDKAADRLTDEAKKYGEDIEQKEEKIREVTTDIADLDTTLKGLNDDMAKLRETFAKDADGNPLPEMSKKQVVDKALEVKESELINLEHEQQEAQRRLAAVDKNDITAYTAAVEAMTKAKLDVRKKEKEIKETERLIKSINETESAKSRKEQQKEKLEGIAEKNKDKYGMGKGKKEEPKKDEKK